MRASLLQPTGYDRALCHLVVRSTGIDPKRHDAAGVVHLTHLQDLVPVLTGSADEPAGTSDGLKPGLTE